MVFLLPSIAFIPIPLVKAQSYTDVSVHIAYEMINNHTQYPNLLILDVRSQSEYDESHLYNATLIPHDEIDARISELEPYKNTEIIVYCRSGSRSAIASQNLASTHNFTKIYNMEGGITEWIIAGYPVWRNDNGSEQPDIGFSLTFFIMILFGTITILLIYYKKNELKQKN
ncbi:MAG: rhodanese-like domain-containing protein [Promethearchaeota archaeon]